MSTIINKGLVIVAGAMDKKRPVDDADTEEQTADTEEQTDETEHETDS